MQDANLENRLNFGVKGRRGHRNTLSGLREFCNGFLAFCNGIAKRGACVE